MKQAIEESIVLLPHPKPSELNGSLTVVDTCHRLGPIMLTENVSGWCFGKLSCIKPMSVW